MSRSKLREMIFTLLFRIEFHPADDFREQVNAHLEQEQENMSDEDREFVLQRCMQVLEALDDIDALLSEKTTGWSLGRIGKVELAILRLAAYEMVYDESIPVSVSINEAVELAKKFATDESASFINGVLAKLA